MFFFFQAEDGIRDVAVTGVQTCALPISAPHRPSDTSARLPPGCTDAAQSALPSTPPARDTRAPAPPRRYTVLHLLPPAHNASLHPTHTSACSLSAAQSALHPRALTLPLPPRTRSNLPPSPLAHTH